MQALAIFMLLGTLQIVLGQNITDVPTCAQICLSDATEAQNACTGVDVKCLCTNPEYVNALSCCLSTACNPSDQQKAITFNMASCAAVNESAPNFVGCSPGVSSSSVFPSGTATLTSKTTTSSSSSSPTDSSITTVTGAIASALTTLYGSVPETATFNGRPLLTGTCSQPSFAQVTDSGGRITQFPQIGCSPDRGGCCPFDSYQKAVLSACPQDYFTTSNACCPSGWQIYFSDFGGQTPCYTMPSITHVPESSPTVAGLTVITEHVFTRKFDLVDKTAKGSKGLGAGAIAGIAIASIVGLATIGALVLFFLRRRKARKVPQATPAAAVASGFGSSEMAVASPASATHELATPHTLPNSPGSTRSAWISPSSPPAYEHNVDPYRPKARAVAQELPGSTFIFEHHPAYTGQEEDTTTPVPSSPPRTPGRTTPQSPHAKTTSTSSPPVVSPLGSPKYK